MLYMQNLRTVSKLDLIGFGVIKILFMISVLNYTEPEAEVKCQTLTYFFLISHHIVLLMRTQRHLPDPAISKYIEIQFTITFLSCK